MNFNELDLIPSILKALDKEGYETPSPIQAEAIPPLLNGKDLLGCAQTGTGKTAAFAIPIIQKLCQLPRPEGTQKRVLRALVLTPTRELASQVAQSFKSYGRYAGVKTTAIFGGVSQKPQVAALQSGVDILVATPGRLCDLVNQKLCNLSNVSMFVLDEADRMLDMGFIHDVKKIIALLSKERQTLLFSATMPKEVASLANSILRNPVTVTVTPVSSAVEVISQSVYFVDKGNKGLLLIDLLKSGAITSALVFSRTKHGADRIGLSLNKAGIRAGVIHGDKSQGARQAALADFKTGTTSVLIATDIAARGIDIDQLSHVINYDLPNESETYVHRIGRTGRAGLSGIAISFCDFDEKAYLNDIQKLIGKKIAVVEEHSYPMQVFRKSPPQTRPRRLPDERGPKPDERRGRSDERKSKPDERRFRPDGSKFKSAEKQGNRRRKKRPV